MPTSNPYSEPHAIALAKAHAGKACVPDLCDHYVGVWYGWGHSGELTAQAHWNHIPKNYRANRARSGMLVFYGNGGAGHVALITDASGAAGQLGTILTTDLPRRGRFALQPITAPERAWGMTLLGFAHPYFPHGLSPVGPLLYPVPHT